MIERIPKYYVGDGYAQVRIPFKKNITIISSDYKNESVLCNYNFNDSSQFVNKYLADDRKNIFPYSNIPIYKELSGNMIDGFNRVYYVNQIFDFNKHYISITDDFCIMDIYLVKNGEEAIIYSRRLFIPDNVKENEITRQNLFDEYNKKSLCTVDRLGNYNNLGNGLLNFYNNCGGLIIFNNNGMITFRMVMFVVKGKYCFKREYDIPFNHYKIEELKAFNSKVRSIKEPKIYSFVNPNIDKNEIKKAKVKIKKINNKQ